MEVVELLKRHGLDSLGEFAIRVKIYAEGLVVLNYDQIESPKIHPIVKECRGLILDEDFNIVSRSFSRFYNFGEADTTFNPAKSVAYEKLDGSLIKIYNWRDVWYISTRGTAFAETEVNSWGLTFKEMVFKALKCYSEEEFQLRAKPLDKSCTYICEVTGIENRIVTRYEGNSLWLLAIRNNYTGEYVPITNTEEVFQFGCKLPLKFTFKSVIDCLNTAKHLPDLKEGYVIYEDGIPVCKVKSPAYVAMHLIKEGGLTPERIVRLVVINEQEEYLQYYEEDRKLFTPYIDTLGESLNHAEEIYSDYNYIKDQKEFALKVKDYPFAQYLFQARKLGVNEISPLFHASEENRKVKYLLKLMGEILR